MSVDPPRPPPEDVPGAVPGTPPAREAAPTPPDGADLPPAGPHAVERLTDDRKTPGAGALPDEDGSGEVDPGAG